MQESWRSQGLCSQLSIDDPLWELYFADTDLERRPARNYCNSCPVREQCLRHALENKEIWGIWGGCDEADIRRVLWVDALGSRSPRSRYPNCPMCKSRPSALRVSSICDLTTRRRRDRVECRACGFYWHSSTSAYAVKAYWKERRRIERDRQRQPQPDNIKPTSSAG